MQASQHLWHAKRPTCSCRVGAVLICQSPKSGMKLWRRWTTPTPAAWPKMLRWGGFTKIGTHWRSFTSTDDAFMQMVLTFLQISTVKLPMWTGKLCQWYHINSYNVWLHVAYLSMGMKKPHSFHRVWWSKQRQSLAGLAPESLLWTGLSSTPRLAQS